MNFFHCSFWTLDAFCPAFSLLLKMSEHFVRPCPDMCATTTTAARKHNKLRMCAEQLESQSQTRAIEAHAPQEQSGALYLAYAMQAMLVIMVHILSE
jgi:hypothetical protein